MTSALEHRVYLLERELFTDGSTRQQLRDLTDRIQELEDRSRGEIGESLVEPGLAHRESQLTVREQAVAAREEAVKAREEQYARAVDANPLPPPHPKDAWLTELAAGAKYLQFVAAGWTDELLEQQGFMAVPR